MKRIKKTFSFLYKCFIIYTLLVYTLLFWFPFEGWFWGFIMMSFPLVILAHVVVLILSIFTNRKNRLLPLTMLLIGCVFLPRTYSFRSDPEDLTYKQNKSFKVMSYNVEGFQHNSQASKEDVNRDINDMKQWIIDTKADVLCMPEYINYSNTAFMDATLELNKAGYKHVAYLNQTKWNMPHSYWGMVIFSKYPIVAQRDTVFEMQNGMIQSDINVNGDTVRFISLHLLSMTLKLNELRQQKTVKGVARESRKTTKLIKRGFDNHALEMNVLESWIKESPYPVIVGGDFNETPYSYVYGKTRSLLRSTFEEKGRGFGFTFNKLPYFIRIDHQFYDDGKLDLLDFQTVDSVRYSDHYPLIGTYQVVKSK